MKRKSPQETSQIIHGFQVFLRGDYAKGTLLLLAALVAILLANGPLSVHYQQVLEHSLILHLGPLEITYTLQEWINSTLMAVFFLSVGLEIKQELVLRSLISARKAALPVAGAIGGMLIPALIFALFN